VSESAVLSALLRCGVSVSVPFGDNDRYDIVVDDEGELLRVQCKTGSWVNGTVRFRLYSSTTEAGGRVDRSYSAGEVDAFAVFAPWNERVYWVPVSETGTGEMRLRVEGPDARAPRSRINRASDYRLSIRSGGDDADAVGV
jgi:hypothetical protein